MKRWLLLMALLAALAGSAWAYRCTQQIIYGPNGTVLTCQTCCTSAGDCETYCY